MATLIVDDESSTRTALRDLLTQLGHKTIIEAKNGEEALKMAETEKSRIRMIVADWEMPYMDGITLLGKIGELPELDLTPFLLITSDLPRSKLEELKAKTDRLDGFLIKPFRMSALSQATHAAQAHRAATRHTLITYEPDSNLEPLKSAATEAGLQIVITRNLAELQEAVKTHARRLGILALGMSAAPPAAGLTEWLAQFSRSPLGTATPILCASRDPQEIFPYRLFCQYFVASQSTTADWRNTLKQVRSRMETTLECELLFQELKASLQKKNSALALKTAKRILELDPANGEAHGSLGDLLEAQDKRPQAIAHYRQALEANPCLPRPYIRLLEIAGEGSEDTAQEAVRYCPLNQDVLLSAARAMQVAGNPTLASEIAQKILVLNPKNGEAQALIKPA
jgi:two-component system chemotaxis response regulator CheY